ncbi:hypothetical protein DM02DRAFT_618696 [Periconia macrospinosa]|uniref:Zn(2)-C6 fungal-type domain-containing protein n=1 Tax=Periconia macrospinosa TaxID=97972 RepID=A0A2V1D8H5_9PLEO|nr:hypothetical protein DM02DRAFT_618696 [Periconia macrospinosa]
MTEDDQRPNGSAASAAAAIQPPSKPAEIGPGPDTSNSSQSRSPSKDSRKPTSKDSKPSKIYKDPKEKHIKRPSLTPGSDAGPSKSPKKRRKVNHACIYCRRSHMTCDLDRPCTRCIKRNIGHLCHDEPREGVKKSKSDSRNANDERDASNQDAASSDQAVNALSQQPSAAPDTGLNLAPPLLPPNRGASAASIAQSTPVSAPQLPSLTSQNPTLLNYNDWTSSSQNHIRDMHQYDPSYMFNTSEVSNEYNLINDFLNSSLMDDNSFYTGGDFHQLFSDASLLNPMGGSLTSSTPYNPNVSDGTQLLPPPAQAASSSSAQRPTGKLPLEKAREKYYMTAADPAGTDSPEERMNKLLKAKMDAGLLRPFNYVKGYARLSQYMDLNMQQISRVRILRQLDRFRPKFRERAQKLTDMELVRVEMWFDKSLMAYDRVFASMAIPACCWRRTGEIFRGNKEMARLIHVPMSRLRDGNIAIHEIIAEPSLVSYWEKFGAIAFDNSQKAILTSCSLKNPDPKSKDPEIRCCFSFTVKRDMYDIPALIVGNFLPILDPTPLPPPSTNP